MTIESGQFRQTLALCPTAVTVVALPVADGVRAMTVGSFASLSLDPPLVLFCIGRRSRLAELLEVGRPFCVSVLRADQQALSTYFAGGWKEPAPPPHRFVPFDGSARLEGAAAAIGGTLTAVVDGGDHLVAVGGVSGLLRGVAPVEPLIFFDRRYYGLEAATGRAAPEIDRADGAVQPFYETW